MDLVIKAATRRPRLPRLAHWILATVAPSGPACLASVSRDVRGLAAVWIVRDLLFVVAQAMRLCDSQTKDV